MGEWERAIAVPAVVTSIEPVPYEPAEVVVAPIEVSPVVVKSLVDPSTPFGIWPLIFKAVADAAERSPK